MKKIMTLLLAGATLLTIPAASLSQDSSATTATLLEQYYNIKDALVNSNAKSAANAAKQISTVLKKLPDNKSGMNQAANANALQQKIQADANTIAGSLDLVKQRAAFQALSESVITLIKTQRQLKPAYIKYCPMKKAYWISSFEQIKNPYYGSSMLTCGNISETLK
ncbi:DUF3347 domain-containing protein [Flavitalea sp.]|nr:DUF3347 domain-containing protein [Flavitalea sp.]